MPQVQTTQAEEEAKAKARVELFRTQAVGIVDKAANGEVFLALKSATPMDGENPAVPADATKAPEAPPAAPPAATKMPAAVKASMTEALGAVLDTCAKMAEVIEKAEIDETAPAPAELLKMAMEAADKLDAMCEPYEPAEMAAPPPPPAAPGAEGEPAQKAAPPPPPPEGPRRRMAMKRIVAMDGVAKALAENASKVGELVAWAKGAAGMPAPDVSKGMASATKADLDPFTALNATLQAVRERMWAACDLIAKDPAKAISELREVGGMLDKAAILATGGGTVPAAPAPSPPPAAVEEAQMAAVQKAVASGVASAKADLIAAVKADLSGLLLAAKGAAAQAQAAQAQAHAALAKVEKSVPAPNAQPAGENTTPPADTPPPADPWRQATQEIQETSQARRKPAAGK